MFLFWTSFFRAEEDFWNFDWFFLKEALELQQEWSFLDDIRFQIFFVIPLSTKNYTHSALMSNLLYSKCRETLWVEVVTCCFDPYKRFHDDFALWLNYNFATFPTKNIIYQTVQFGTLFEVMTSACVNS